MSKRPYIIKRKTGHLIIHDVTQKETEKINELLINARMERAADWWPDAEMEQFDNAAVAAILASNTRNKKLRRGISFHTAGNIVHYGGRQSADSN